jgi:hypothetical protein
MALRILPPMTEPEPYSYIRRRQDWNNPLHYKHNLEFSEVAINLKTTKAPASPCQIACSPAPTR